MKTSKQIRQEFLDFFNKKNHKIIKSAPSIPQNDPTLLFTNAGMNQFKGIFLNTEEITNPRVADTQKCIRVSGKHNDLEEVGHDTYHHTYFEMLGNWSFGDYYKKEAIQFAWELLTKVWEMDKERLWVTVYKDDKEAEDYWKQFTDIAPDRILKFGDKDNFWEMGETGPCGPCSEIHYYSGDTPKNQEAKKINADDPEYIEIWNLVFIQYNRNSKGLSPLPKKHVDTGMGFERVVAVLQNKKSNYDTDLFQPIIQKVAQISKIPYSQEKGIPHRVIADHIRMLTISLSDGGLPSNEGRGYVMRRILRRAVRYGKMLNLHEPFLFQLVDNVVNILGDIFPEIVDKKEHIQKVIKAEEVSFSETLDRGLEVFEKLYKSTIDNNSKILSGKDAFKLYDTFGFPLDLTCLIAREKNLDVDQDGFNKEMEKQKQRARESAGFKIAKNDQTEWITLSQGEDSEFIGYNKLSCSSKIRKYGFEKNHIKLILSKTVFYAESGGEIGDVGEISGKDFTIKIENTVKSNNMFIHIGQIQQGQIGKNPDVVLKVDSKSDSAIRSNHSATHLLHSALKSVLGDHIQQAGSLVTDERLRFDLTHYEKISVDEIFKIENIINNKIRENLLISKTVKSYDEAKKEGATALFGEKYGNEVRVVTIPNFSKELCGGKHAKRTGDIGIFKIIAESSVAAGVRRIEAITGSMANSLKVIKIFRIKFLNRNP